jgi:hypothetical protein
MNSARSPETAIANAPINIGTGSETRRCAVSSSRIGTLSSSGNIPIGIPATCTATHGSIPTPRSRRRRPRLCSPPGRLSAMLATSQTIDSIASVSTVADYGTMIPTTIDWTPGVGRHVSRRLRPQGAGVSRVTECLARAAGCKAVVTTCRRERRRNLCWRATTMCSYRSRNTVHRVTATYVPY